MRADMVVIGGGIVGLATAWHLQQRDPRARVVVLEKEKAPGLHQSGRNSGVLHTGIYYRPGSSKALLCASGRRAMIDFCRRHDVPHETCGKVIVATSESELPRLEELGRRAAANGIPCETIGPGRLNELEPHVRGLAALHVPGAGIVDFSRVMAVLVRCIEAGEGTIVPECRVLGMREGPGEVLIETTRGEVSGRQVVNCAGLHSDRVMKTSGARPPAQIVPFRGEYYLLKETARHLCRHLVYPVPDPSFPFLGVHFTRSVHGEVEAGPNAVLAFAREGYTFSTVDAGDLLETLGHPGFRRLAARHWKVGLGEMWRSLNKRAFVRALQRLIPEIGGRDLEPAPAGVRAQAVTAAGALVDDFLIERRGPVVHVCNAPSPAATSAFAIGASVAAQVPAAARATHRS